jgi:hypothetical protein
MVDSANPVDGSGPPVPIVSVRGDATLEVPPEIARLSAMVTAEDRDRRSTLERLSRRNDETLALIRSYGPGVEGLDTGSMSVYPVMKATGRGTEKVRFYRGTVRIRATVGDFTILGELAGRLADMELVELHGPWWELRPDSPVHRQAREDAAREAVRRAREYAGAVGGTLTALLEIADRGLSSQPQAHVLRGAVPVQAGAAAYGGAPPPPVLDLEPATQTVSAGVEARFTMTQPEHLG